MSNSLPALRERPWYVVVWGILFVISGSWTFLGIIIVFSLVFMGTELGYAGLGRAAFLLFSIPIYCLFLGLLFAQPKAVKVKVKKEDVRYDY